MTIQILKRRFVDVGMPKHRIGAKGRFKVFTLERGIYVAETPWFDNLILDSGLNRWGTGSVVLGAAIGTGTATPDVAQTGLQSQTTYTTTAGTGNNTGTTPGVSPYNNSRIHVFRTALGALNGNYTEVGAGWASGSMFSRALILDTFGSPTTLPVTSDQQLDIVYELSVYPPLTDYTDTVTISGVSYDILGRASTVNSGVGSSSAKAWAIGTTSGFGLSSASSNARTYNGAIGLITSSTPGGGFGTDGVATTDAYVANSYQRTGFMSYGLTQGNAGPVRSVIATWADKAVFQYEFNPVLPKDSTKTMVLNYLVGWGRH